MDVVFLDIDGVLNSDEYFASNNNDVIKYYKENKDISNNIEKRITVQMMDIDMNKFNMLKDAVNALGVYVVIVSSWKKLSVYPQLKEKLISMGLPIIGETKDNGSDRGNGIKNYLKVHEVSNYVILDDDIFKDYDDELLSRLIKTSFYEDGLKEEHIDRLFNSFGNQNVRKK